MSFFGHFITCWAKNKIIGIAARDMTFSPHNPKKHVSQAAIWIFLEKLILATSAKYRHPITSFTRPNATTQCKMQQHTRPKATALKTKCNSTPPFSTMGSAFMLMQHQSFVNNFFLMMRARINVTDKLANRCARLCWIELDWQFEKYV
jgi:hypothetical protein